MAKKRRTKAQKQRAAIHRHEQLQSVLAPAVERVKTVTQPKRTKEVVTAEPAKTPDNFRQRDLKRSVVILGSLIILQVVLWLALSQTDLASKLYNWIQL